jgi:hypothetical protein
MHIKNAIIFIFCLFQLNSYAQIKIDNVGDGWQPMVEEAINIIKVTDTNAYNLLNKNCNRIEFIIGDRSTTKPPNVIAITVNDMKLKSINNIAAILVHESYHLHIWDLYRKKGISVNEKREEFEAYRYEYYFLKKIKNIEPWILSNALNQSIRYSD